METQSDDLRIYLAALHRRRVPMVMCTILVFSLAAAIVFALPSIYRSTATILIEEQEIPQNLVPMPISSFADQRLDIVSQLVMTDANLRKIVTEFNLYPSDADRLDRAVERLRNDMLLETVSTEGRDKRKGNNGEAYIAFKLSFESKDPETALKVTNKLAALYLDENVKTRGKIASETKEFLSAEVAQLDRKVADLEIKLADFKKQYPDQLSEFSQFHQKPKERLEQNLLEIDRKVRMLQAQRVGLKAKLAQTSSTLSVDNTKPNLLDPISKLEVLRAEYLSLSTRYSAQHPDVKKVKEQINALEATQGAGSGTRRGLPANPAYVQTNSDLSAVSSELSSLMQSRKETLNELAKYETMRVMSPEVEKEYLQLKRNYDNTLEQYKMLRAKELQAHLGQELEKEGLGGRYTLIDPPKLPMEPVKPYRFAILLLAIPFSIAIGIGYVVVLEAMDPSVRGARELATITGSRPLAIIPNMDAKHFSLNQSN